MCAEKDKQTLNVYNTKGEKNTSSTDGRIPECSPSGTSLPSPSILLPTSSDPNITPIVSGRRVTKYPQSLTPSLPWPPSFPRSMVKSPATINSALLGFCAITTSTSRIAYRRPEPGIIPQCTSAYPPLPADKQWRSSQIVVLPWLRRWGSPNRRYWHHPGVGSVMALQWPYNLKVSACKSPP